MQTFAIRNCSGVDSPLEGRHGHRIAYEMSYSNGKQSTLVTSSSTVDGTHHMRGPYLESRQRIFSVNLGTLAEAR